jgi:hypothetical protein
MFGLFKSSSYSDPALGTFDRKRGRWRGAIDLNGVQIPLALSGGGTQPDASALAIAKDLPAMFIRDRERLSSALFEHYEPYAEAVAEGELAPGSPLPTIHTPSDTWPYVEVESASVTPLGRNLCAEVALRCAWDEEHTLGARYVNGTFVELNGSILPE